MADYYAVLGVAPSCDSKTLRDAYLRLAKKYHPDAQHSQVENGSDAAPNAAELEWRVEAFKAVNEAYEVLSDAEKRRAYDELYAYSHIPGRAQHRAASAAAAASGTGSYTRAAGRAAHVRVDEPVFDFRAWNDAHFGPPPAAAAAAAAQRVREAKTTGFAFVHGDKGGRPGTHGRTTGYEGRRAAREQYDVWLREHATTGDERSAYQRWAREYATQRTRLRLWPLLAVGAVVYFVARRLHDDEH